MPIICNNEKIFFTYDIGHEISNMGNITGVNPILLLMLNNVHIHTLSKNYDYGFYHKPILS